jgi:DNA-binding NarL/FixJ family response regulator
MPVTIVIADDHRLFRDGLRALLEQQKWISVIGEAADGPGAVAAALRLKPDIVLMDVSMPELNGIEATRRIVAELAETAVVVLSMHADRRFVVESLRAGAKGFILKDCAFEEITLAIKTVSNHRVYLSSAINDSVVKDYISMQSKSPRGVFSLLTSREREVLQLVAEGKTTKETAARLGISVKTVETHRKQIMDRLGVRSVAELTKFAVREGLTPLD